MTEAKLHAKELTGAALDWAVAKCEGYSPINHTRLANQWVERRNARGVMDPCPVSSLRYSTDWAKGGPIIEREEIAITPTGDSSRWKSYVWDVHAQNFTNPLYGSTSLIAAMRCYVAKKLGAVVEVPYEILG